MGFFPDNAISGLSHTLAAISQRQRVNAANLSNAATPGYTAKEVSFADILRTDNPFETAMSQRMGGKITEISAETGVPVSIQKELIEMQKNMLFYSMATRRTSTIFNGLKTASQIGR